MSIEENTGTADNVGRRIYIRTFDWSLVQVARNDIAVAEDVKWFRIREL